jgi:two-component system sensor histidine kinase PilS (NtrC family)
MNAELVARLRKLIFLRLVMVTTLLLIAVYVEAASEYLVPINPLYFLIVATYVFTVFHGLALRFWKDYVAQVYVQVIGDLLIITGLVYVNGGSRAGFLLLYPISVLSASALLYRRGGIILAGLATALYATVLWAVRFRVIPPQGLSDVLFLTPKVLFYSIFVTGVACATVAWVGSYLSESLRTVGAQLEEATGQVANLRQMNEVIVSSIHSGLLTADSLARVLHVNEFGENLLGRRARDIRGKPLSSVLGSRLLEPSALKARAAGVTRLEISYTRPDGVVVDLGVSISALATAEPGHLLVFRDLTEIKRLENDARIKEKLAAVGEMAAHLAHEIRNPLGSISGSAQVLMSEPNISPEQEKLLAIIKRESKRLSDALSQFLVHTRISPQAPAVVDIGPVIGEAVTLLRNGNEVGEDHEVRFDCDEGPHLCLADPDQLLQVFWNLTRNGLEAMPDGGVLSIRLTHTEDEIILSVRDRGRGMGREEQRRMFEPFHSQSAMGTGLGLAIVYRIIRDHRGDITVRSAPAQGTEVEVRLPLVSVAVPA